MMEDFEQAKMSFEAAIATYEKLPHFKTYMLSIPLANIGLAYWLMGQFDNAFQFLERGIGDRVEFIGVDDHESFRFVVLGDTQSRLTRT